MKAAHQVGHFSRATRRLLVLAGFVALALSLLLRLPLLHLICS